MISLFMIKTAIDITEMATATRLVFCISLQSDIEIWKDTVFNFKFEWFLSANPWHKYNFQIKQTSLLISLLWVISVGYWKGYKS